MTEKLAKNINEFLISFGIEPFYILSIVAIIISVSYRNEIKKWSELPDWRKSLIISTIFGAVLFSLISVLIYFGLIDKN